jgi:hypothetical protein
VLGISDLEMVVEAVEAKFDFLDLEWGWSGYIPFEPVFLRTHLGYVPTCGWRVDGHVDGDVDVFGGEEKVESSFG